MMMRKRNAPMIRHALSSDWHLLSSSEAIITPEGGLACRYINKTGEASVKGTVVKVYSATAIDHAVDKIVIDVPSPFGVIYDDGISDGSYVRVVVSGKAEVLFVGDTLRGYIARGFITGDDDYIAGYALSVIYPTPPHDVDKHFYEIGHILASRTGPGLAFCNLHFN